MQRIPGFQSGEFVNTTAPPDVDYEQNTDNDIQYVITANREIYDDDLEKLRKLNGLTNHAQS